VVLVTAGVTLEIGDLRVAQRSTTGRRGRKSHSEGDSGKHVHRDLKRAAPTRETNGGMRRCQRLPEVTHPVDSTRPEPQHIKSHARPGRPETPEKPEQSADRSS